MVELLLCFIAIVALLATAVKYVASALDEMVTLRPNLSLNTSGILKYGFVTHVLID